MKNGLAVKSHIMHVSFHFLNIELKIGPCV